MTKHEHLTEVLRKRIESSEYDDEMPSEASLMSEFGYARSVVRQAFATLENEGLLTASSGARRRIVRQKRWYWPMTTWENNHTADADAWAQSIKKQGGEPSTYVAVNVEQAEHEIAQALGIEDGSRVIVRRRIRSVNGDPHQFADSYFPAWLTDEHPVFLQPGDISAPGGLLASVGLPQARYLDEIGARMPTPDEARTLKAGRGVPLIVHTRTGYADDGRPIRHMVTRMSADRARVCYEVQP